MGVVNTKSTAITNADASPVTPTPGYLAHGRNREAVGTVEVAAADSDTSVYRMVRVPSCARVSQIMVANDAITSGSSYDIGLYQIAANGGAVADADCWASAVTMVTARALWTDFTFEAGAAGGDQANCEKRIWELLGLAADPKISYDICFTANTVGSGAGTLSLLVKYTDGT